LRTYLDGDDKPAEGEKPLPPVLTDRIGEATRPPPGTSHMTNMPFTRLERHVE